MIIQYMLLLLLVTGVSQTAFAGPIEVDAIQVVPAETGVGKYPEITGSVKARQDLARGETVEITVIAVVVRPDQVMKSWSWKRVSMKAGEIRSFSIPKEYELTSAGTYTVDFNIYSKDMLPLHRLSKTFVAVDPSLVTKTTPEADNAHIEASSVQAAGRPAEHQRIGIGAYANTLNGAGGATVLLWPFKKVGLQASYTTGSFTIAEGRLLTRFPLSSGINPYLGIGYVNVATERTVETINIKTRFQGSGVSGVIGAELPIRKSLFGYVEISGASVDLKKEVTSGAISGTATVKYAPVTIGTGLVYYLF